MGRKGQFCFKNTPNWILKGCEWSGDPCLPVQPRHVQVRQPGVMSCLALRLKTAGVNLRPFSARLFSAQSQARCLKSPRKCHVLRLPSAAASAHLNIRAFDVPPLARLYSASAEPENKQRGVQKRMKVCKHTPCLCSTYILWLKNWNSQIFMFTRLCFNTYVRWVASVVAWNLSFKKKFDEFSRYFAWVSNFGGNLF